MNSADIDEFIAAYRKVKPLITPSYRKMVDKAILQMCREHQRADLASIQLGMPKRVRASYAK